MWSDPDTRERLLAGLVDKGFGRGPLAEMQKIIDAQDSDCTTCWPTWHLHPSQSADGCAAAAKAAAANDLTDKQRAFVDFVLAQHVSQGVDELDQEKLGPLLKLRYKSAIADALAELGKPGQVRRVFVGFQKHLYSREVRAT